MINWYLQNGKDSDVVISSRIRLARNLADFPFKEKAKTKDLEQVLKTIKEITPSEGYLLDDTVYSVGAEAKNYTVEKNTVKMTVKEDVIKGKISIVKHSDDGTTQIETPEQGAEFEVYLKSAGSYEKAKDAEKDYLICDKNGFDETKLMPYGIYVVHQTKGWENTEWIEDFDVIISENEKEYFYLINDAALTSYVRIVKKDAETGNLIPVSGIGFKVWDCKNSRYVEQKIPGDRGADGGGIFSRQ